VEYNNQARLTKREKRIARQNGDAQEGLTFKTQNFNLILPLPL
jgi:hypothetical protein